MIYDTHDILYFICYFICHFFTELCYYLKQLSVTLIVMLFFCDITILVLLDFENSNKVKKGENGRDGGREKKLNGPAIPRLAHSAQPNKGNLYKKGEKAETPAIALP